MRLCLFCVFIGFLVPVMPAWAAGRAELVVVTEPRAPLMASQQWARALGEAGITAVRIRGRRGTDKIGVEVQGTAERPTYVATGVLNARGELLLPGGRYRKRDAARVARWLDELAAQGPPERREPKTAFGLTQKEFAQVRDDLSRPISFKTAGLTRREVMEKMARHLLLPLKVDDRRFGPWSGEKIETELEGLACGTVLAYVLHEAEMTLVPRPSGEADAEYAVVAARPGQKAWPVGWEAEDARREVLPVLFEFLNVNIEGVSVAKALEAIAGRMEVPVLLDHRAMKKHDIEPEKVQAQLPRSRTTYSLLLGKVLFQARLKFEVRLDDAGRPFLWVTTIKPA